MNPKRYAASKLAEELQAFHKQLISYGAGYENVAAWVAESARNVLGQLHTGWWPPAWWRQGRVRGEAQALAHHFHRVDAEGFFYGAEKSSRRKEILETVDAIAGRYEAAVGGRAQQGIQADAASPRRLT